MQISELRPLGAGEILDRAITLFVRRFGPIATALAVVIVPVTIVQAFADPQSAAVVTDFGRLLSSMNDPAASKKIADEMARTNPSAAGLFITIVVAGAMRLLMWCALVRIIATAYEGGTVRLGDAYRFALSRWLPQVGVAFAYLVLGGVAMIPVFVIYLVFVVVGAGLAAANAGPAAIAVVIVGVLVMLAGLLVLGSFAMMAYQLASVALLTETGNFVEAITIGLQRAFARGMKRRMIAGGVVIALVSQAGLLPIMMIAVLLTTLTHVAPLYYAVFGAGSLLLDGIVASFVVVFATDVRVRREGYDLQAALATT